MFPLYSQLALAKVKLNAGVLTHTTQKPGASVSEKKAASSLTDKLKTTVVQR